MLSNEVECDEAYVIAGHKGQPEVVKEKGRKGRRRRLKGKCGRGTLAKERPPVFGMMQRVVYLSPADKYHRLTRRLSKGQKFYERGLSWHHSGPLSPGDALDAGHADTPTPHQLTATRRALCCALFLTPLLAAATAVPETAAPRAGSRHGRSVQRPSRACTVAIAWPSPSRWSDPAGGVAGAHSHGAGRSCRSRGTRPVAGPGPLRPCRVC